MESPSIRVLDVVALVEDLADRGLRRGQVGTVVERLDDEVFEVEFCDNEGRTYATLALRRPVDCPALRAGPGCLRPAHVRQTASAISPQPNPLPEGEGDVR